MAEENSEGKTKMGNKKKSPVVLILTVLLVLVLLGGAAAGYFMFLAPQAKTSQPAAAETPRPAGQDGASTTALAGHMKTLDSFIVNLTDSQGTRYLKVVMQMEMSNEFLGAEVDRKNAQIRDEIIMLLSSKSFDDISTVAGKRALKRSILNCINKYLASGRVLQVYFSDFVVQ